MTTKGGGRRVEGEEIWMDGVRELVLARGIMREGLGREDGGEDLVMDGWGK